MKLFFFAYHKVGSKLRANLARRLCAHFGWSAPEERLGLVTEIEPSAPITILGHSLIGFDLCAVPHRGVRIVRDPRDIWVSGYHYHLRCNERWCVNEDFSTAAPIRLPQIDYSREHYPEDWKRAFLAGLGGRSYQANLRSLDRNAGMIFELDRYTGWTLEAMAGWKADPDVIDVRLEDLAEDFDHQLARILRHFGIAEAALPGAVQCCEPEDLGRMSDDQVAASDHIRGRPISSWKDQLTKFQIALVDHRHGELIRRLGYEPSRIGGTTRGVSA